MSRYELRLLLWSWGLIVDIGLTARSSVKEPLGGIPIRQGAWLKIDPSLDFWDGDLPPLIKGLRRVAPRFSSVLSAGGDSVVFVLDHLWYPSTDYQEDAMELAVAGWAVESLGLPDEPAKVLFDRAKNRYLIEFNESVWDPGNGAQ